MTYSLRYQDGIKVLNKNVYESKGSKLIDPSWDYLDDNQEMIIRGVPYALTGSRYFQWLGKDISRKTDWDFFTPYSKETEEYLFTLGFELLHTISSEYKDSDVVKVYRAINIQLYVPDEDIPVQVDIQLVKDYSRRLLIRNVMKRMYLPWDSISKEGRSHIWDGMYLVSALPGIE